jgi:hypothetical protein
MSGHKFIEHPVCTVHRNVIRMWRRHSLVGQGFHRDGVSSGSGSGSHGLSFWGYWVLQVQSRQVVRSGFRVSGFGVRDLVLEIR